MCDKGIYDSAGRYLPNGVGNSDIFKMKCGVIVSKRCPQCKKFLPIEYFNIKKKVKLDSVQPYSSNCPECRSILTADRERCIKIRKMVRDSMGIRMYQCCTCKEFKYKQDYWKRKDRPSGIMYQCKDCSYRSAQERKTRMNNSKDNGNANKQQVRESGSNLEQGFQERQPIPVYQH